MLTLASLNDAPTPQFKVDIRNAPIPEEDGDANAALANVANTLRAVRYLLPVRARRPLLTTLAASDAAPETEHYPWPQGRSQHDLSAWPTNS